MLYRRSPVKFISDPPIEKACRSFANLMLATTTLLYDMVKEFSSPNIRDETEELPNNLIILRTSDIRGRNPRSI